MAGFNQQISVCTGTSFYSSDMTGIWCSSYSKHIMVTCFCLLTSCQHKQVRCWKFEIYNFTFYKETVKYCIQKQLPLGLERSSETRDSCTKLSSPASSVCRSCVNTSATLGMCSGVSRHSAGRSLIACFRIWENKLGFVFSSLDRIKQCMVTAHDRERERSRFRKITKQGKHCGWH